MVIFLSVSEHQRILFTEKGFIINSTVQVPQKIEDAQRMFTKEIINSTEKHYISQWT